MSDNQQPTDIRTRLEAHAAACRTARDRCAVLPPLPGDLMNLSDTNLSGANLRGANLSDTDLSGANLSGANLSGAKRRDRTMATGVARTVTGGRYAVLTYRTTVGRVLEYGCEAQTLADWRSQVDALCQAHEPTRAADYAVEIRALLAWCETLDMLQENPQ